MYYEDSRQKNKRRQILKVNRAKVYRTLREQNETIIKLKKEAE